MVSIAEPSLPELNGVLRIPRASNQIRMFTLEAVGNWSIGTLTSSTTVTPFVQTYALQVSIAAIDTGASTSADDAVVNVFINENLLATYRLPATITTGVEPWQVNDIAYTTPLQLLGGSNTLRIERICTGISGAYRANVKVNLYATEF